MRVSATLLESFRLFQTEDWMTEDRLRESILGTVTPSHEMDLGKAYHAILEAPDVYRVSGGYRCGAFAFGDDVMQPMLDVIDRRGVFEVKTTLDVDGCTLVCQADQLVGASLYEYKTTSSGYDVQKYLDSYQWRVMALAFQPVSITYRTACLYEGTNGVIDCRSVETVTVYPYPELPADVRRLLAQFKEYAVSRGLDGHLRERQRVADAA